MLGAEVDTEGGYHAHVTTADGDLLLVDLDADLAGHSDGAYQRGHPAPVSLLAPEQVPVTGAPAGGAPQDGVAPAPGT